MTINIKKQFLSFILLIFFLNGNSQIDPKAQNEYIKYLQIIENSIDSELNYNEYQEYLLAIEIIEEVTKINSNSDFQIDGELKLPVKYNIEDWRNWYIENAFLLYKDKTSGALLTRKAPNSLMKNPAKLFSRYLADLQKMKKTNSYSYAEHIYLVGEITSLIGRKRLDSFDGLMDEKTIKYLKTWFESNRDKLHWDQKEQRITFLSM